MCVCVAVTKYTREAGVRTLERRIGAVCRAVAVRVAESLESSKNIKVGSIHPKIHSYLLLYSITSQCCHVCSCLRVKDASDAATNENQEAASSADSNALGIDGDTLVNLPPEMPIVIDEQAVEDILGVGNTKHTVDANGAIFFNS